MIWLPYMETEIANHEPNLKNFLKVLFLLKKKITFLLPAYVILKI